VGVRIGIFIAAAVLGAAFSIAAEARPVMGRVPEQGARTSDVGQCLKGEVTISQQEVDKARSAAKSLMDDYWLLALVSDTADVTPALQPAGTATWVDGTIELNRDQMKRLKDPFARNPQLTLASQPMSFAQSAAQGNNSARGVWPAFALADHSNVVGYYVVDFSRANDRWGISRLELVRAPAELPVARPFCVRPGDIEVAASVRSGSEATAVARAPTVVARPVAVVSEYRISTGDKIKITTFGEDRFSGEFLVHGGGKITFPLFGDISAAGLTAPELAGVIKNRLAPDYLRDPQVTAEIISFRPVYVLGEVARPGQYPYSEGMTMYALIAQAGGFSYRANHKRAYVRHDGQTAEQMLDIESSTPIMPGDTVRIGQRIF
jgi:polysaccharide export outer membrane protein